MKFYCTAGRGTEVFVVEEIRRLFGQDVKIISTEGKLYFTVNNYGSNTMQLLMSLKTVERVFVEVLHEIFSKLDRRGLLTLLHTRLNDKVIWEECLSTLKHLSASSQQNTIPGNRADTTDCCITGVNKQHNTEQHFTENLTPKVDTANETIKYEVRKSWSQAGSDNNNLMSETGIVPEIGVDVCSDTNNWFKAGEISKTESVSILKNNDDIDILRTNNKRKISESDICVCIQDKDKRGKILEIDTTACAVHDDNNEVNVSETGTNGSSVCSSNGMMMLESDINNIVPLHNDTRMSETDTSVREKPLNPTSSNVTKITPVPCEYSNSRKRRKLERNYTETFRVSCRFSGYARKQLNVQRSSQQMGVLISKLLGWKIDLRHPKYEINIHLGDGTLTVGIPLTDIPLSKRPYIKHCGLRTPIAAIMASLLDVGPGCVVLDPMCGCATILIEASKKCQSAVFIGMDNDTSQLGLAAENFIHYDQSNIFMSLIHGDVRHIPLSDNSVDGVITDAPFGQNHVVVGNLHAFYCQMVSEIARVVKHGGKIVLLTSLDMVQYVTEFCIETFTDARSNIISPNARPEGAEVGNLESKNCPQIKEDVLEINKHEISGKSLENSKRDLDTSGAQLSLLLMATNNVKLGETEGCILVMQKSPLPKI